MLLRALLVLLVILNVGVAVWWTVRSAPDDTTATVDAGTATLQLVGELPARAPSPAAEAFAEPVATVDPATMDPAVDADVDVDADPAADVAIIGTQSPADPPQCVALGPYPDAQARDAAAALLGAVAVRVAPRDVAETPRGWRVWMAPLPDRAAVDAMIARLLEAGFNDYYVIAEGAETNGIALGRFGSEAPARSRAQALRAAGFEAEPAPLGGTLVRYWIDAVAARGGNGEALRARAGAARVTPRDCDAVGEAG